MIESCGKCTDEWKKLKEHNVSCHFIVEHFDRKIITNICGPLIGQVCVFSNIAHIEALTCQKTCIRNTSPSVLN